MIDLTKIVDKIISAYKNRQWVSMISMSHPPLPLAYGQNALAMISESRLSADDGDSSLGSNSVSHSRCQCATTIAHTSIPFIYPLAKVQEPLLPKLSHFLFH